MTEIIIYIISTVTLSMSEYVYNGTLEECWHEAYEITLNEDTDLVAGCRELNYEKIL